MLHDKKVLCGSSLDEQRYLLEINLFQHLLPMTSIQGNPSRSDLESFPGDVFSSSRGELLLKALEWWEESFTKDTVDSRLDFKAVAAWCASTNLSNFM